MGIDPRFVHGCCHWMLYTFVLRFNVQIPLFNSILLLYLCLQMVIVICNSEHKIGHVKLLKMHYVLVGSVILKLYAGPPRVLFPILCTSICCSLYHGFSAPANSVYEFVPVSLFN